MRSTRFDLQHIKTTGSRIRTRWMYYASSITLSERPGGYQLYVPDRGAQLVSLTIARRRSRATLVFSSISITYQAEPRLVTVTGAMSRRWRRSTQAPIPRRRSDGSRTAPIRSTIRSRRSRISADASSAAPSLRELARAPDLETASGPCRNCQAKPLLWLSRSCRCQASQLIGSVTNDGVAWNYAYTNVRNSCYRSRATCTTG